MPNLTKKVGIFALFLILLGLIIPIAGATSNVIITLTNNQGVATTANMPQMITFNALQITASSNLASDLGNIRFYEGGSQLYSWCESNCTSTPTGNTIIWVKLPFTIAASGSNTLNMTFLSNGTEYDAIFSGEAPYLSSKYALYDNGNQIFTLYQDFLGTSCPYGWTCSGATIANSVVIPSSVGNNYIQTNATFSVNSIAEGFGLIPINPSAFDIGFGFSVSTQGYPGAGAYADTNAGAQYIFTDDGAAFHYTTASYTTSGNSIYGIYYIPLISANVFQNYIVGATTTTRIPSGALNIFSGTQAGSIGNQGSQTFYWIRERISPPVQILPSYSYTTVTTTSTTSTTTTTSTSTTTSATTTISTIVTTSIALPQAGDVGGLLLSGFNIIPFFVYGLIIFAGGAALITSRRLTIALFMATLTSYALYSFGAIFNFGAKFMPLSIVGLLTVVFTLVVLYDIFANHKQLI